jgi:Winged helix DNA-binding domain
LAIRARARRVSATEIDRALSEGRSLVVSWLNRGTLHLVATEDYWWLHPLTTPPVLAANSRMLTQHGVSPAGVERAVELIAAQLGAAGPRPGSCASGCARPGYR